VYLYALKDPRTNEIRYIGKTTRPALERLKDHISNSRGRKNINRCTNWICSLLSVDCRPELVILRDDIQLEEHLNTEEIAMISFCRDAGFNLVNMTGGHTFNFIGEINETTQL